MLFNFLILKFLQIKTPTKLILFSSLLIPFFISSCANVSTNKKNDAFANTNKDSKIKDGINPATKSQTNLYRQIGINYLCRARIADVEFDKALAISSATFADIINQKHQGYLEELADQKLNQEQLYYSAELQLLEGAIRFCSDKVPEEAKLKFDDFIKKQNTSTQLQKK